MRARVWVLACLAALLSATPVVSQGAVTVFAEWDLDPTHLATDTWQLEASGVIVPCLGVQVTADSRRCSAQVALGSTAFRLRGVRGGEVGAWSAPASGTLPGAFTIRSVQ